MLVMSPIAGSLHPVARQRLMATSTLAASIDQLGRRMNDYPKCNLRLRKLGHPYPRTCAECGLGPCKDDIYRAKIHDDEREALHAIINQIKSEYEKALRPYYERLYAIDSLHMTSTMTMSEEQFKRNFLTDIKPNE
jgi:hypothetical protein